LKFSNQTILSIPAAGLARLLFYSALLLFMGVRGFSGEARPPVDIPGQAFPPPRQLGLDRVDSLPVHDETCPACGFAVSVPDMDKLLQIDVNRNLPADAKWTMHAVEYDSDLCPYPGKGKVAFQADIVICPSCGYAEKNTVFSEPLDQDTAAWARDTLRSSMRPFQLRLLGQRGGEMKDEEIAVFYNVQEEVPDLIRTEHYRIVQTAKNAPPLVRAEAAWRAAWSCRKEFAAPPRGDFLAKRVGNIEAKLEKAAKAPAGVKERTSALRDLLTKRDKGGNQLLNAPERYAGAVLLAGLLDRQGRRQDAESVLSRTYVSARERYSREEQDPLWASTSGKGVLRNARPQILENARAEIEQEISARLSLLANEREYLYEALMFIEEAMLGDAIKDRDQALFYGYLIGEFHRRHGDLPLAVVWFKEVSNIADPESSYAKAAVLQYDEVVEQAAGNVNLLSAIGQEGELIEKLRKICKTE
jgi:hypothetical protein